MENKMRLTGQPPKREYPKLWKYPTRMLREQALAFSRMRSQARFRKQEWLLTLEEFNSIWTADLWQRRGRSADDLCMSRRDLTGPWTRENIIIESRVDMVSRTTTLRKPEPEPKQSPARPPITLDTVRELDRVIVELQQRTGHPMNHKPSKYTEEQKAAALRASKLVEELNDLMKQVVARNETREPK